MIRAPWTDAQVELLKQWQEHGMVHPFTCPGERPECKGHRELIPTNDGWVCNCGEYKQDWAHGFMFAKVPDFFGPGGS